MEENDSVAVYYTPPVRKFTDTGYVSHGFSGGSSVTAKVVKSNDSGGFAIRMIIKDNEEELCDVTLDRFAALCLVDCLVKNLLNQEELTYNG